MRYLCLCFLFSTIISCKAQVGDRSNTDSNQTTISLPPLPRFFPESNISYSISKFNALKIKNKLHLSMPEDSLSAALTQILLEKIFPYWYGTPWSFEGHTSIPGQGTIACGYFVSTTLKDAGMNLNRYHLAQQLPIHEAKTISVNDIVFSISEAGLEENAQKIITLLNDGIHFIGFDKYHVGFILKQEGQLILIHSNYYAPKGVVMEYALQSEVFRRCSQFYIAKISGNKSLMDKWLNNNEITIIRE